MHRCEVFSFWQPHWRQAKGGAGINIFRPGIFVSVGWVCRLNSITPWSHSILFPLLSLVNYALLPRCSWVAPAWDLRLNGLMEHRPIRSNAGSLWISTGLPSPVWIVSTARSSAPCSDVQLQWSSYRVTLSLGFFLPGGRFSLEFVIWKFEFQMMSDCETSSSLLAQSLFFWRGKIREYSSRLT